MPPPASLSSEVAPLNSETFPAVPLPYGTPFVCVHVICAFPPISAKVQSPTIGAPVPPPFCITNAVDAAWLLLVPGGAVGTMQLGFCGPQPCAEAVSPANPHSVAAARAAKTSLRMDD